MIPEIYPEYYKGTLYSFLISRKWIQGKKALIKNADKIIAISEKTKEDLINIYNIPDDKIKVIYHGYNKFNKIGGRLISEPYILYVGLRDKYKNFNTFVLGLKSILLKKQIKILCIGGGQFTKNEINLLKDHKILKYIIQLTANDATLASAYKNALCFVFPSEYEGFGMPILEAFSMECPVILNNKSCFPEIAQDAALYFDSKNPNDVEEKISELINNNTLRQELISNGKIRLNSFSWNQCKKQTSDLYNELF